MISLTLLKTQSDTCFFTLLSSKVSHKVAPWTDYFPRRANLRDAARGGINCAEYCAPLSLSHEHPCCEVVSDQLRKTFQRRHLEFQLESFRE